MYAKIVEGVVKQTQPNEQEGFIFVDDNVICGQLLVDGEFINPPPPPKTQEEIDDEKKLSGFEFEGVMCSATKKDQIGLLAVDKYIGTGASTNFEFENGNVLRVTPENFAEFSLQWMTFRASFFE